MNIQISHQAGEWSITLPDHTTELTNWLRHARDVHIMKKHVPEFHACRCQGRGTSAMTKPIKATTGNKGYVGSSVITSKKESKYQTEGLERAKSCVVSRRDPGGASNDGEQLEARAAVIILV
jgi:hypothetical protein